MPGKTPRAELEAQLHKDHAGYTDAFKAADMETIAKYCTFPLAYIGENYVRKAEKYPFDLKKLQAKTGMSGAESVETVFAIDDSKCHLISEARRLKPDGSLAQHNSAFYLFLKKEGVWKVAAFSGIQTDAKDVTPEMDEALKAKIAGRKYNGPPVTKSGRRLELEKEVKAGSKEYNRAFGRADMDAMNHHITHPIAYLGDDFLKIGDAYPFDLGKLQKRIAGGAKAKPKADAADGAKKKPGIVGEVKETLLAVDENKAHVLIEGRRCAPDGSLSEQNRAFYIFMKDNGEWKTACFSGILTKAADVDPNEDAAFQAHCKDRTTEGPWPGMQASAKL